MSLEYWDKFKQPPDWAMGKIGGGKLSGKTDINPQWRIQVMTETFGPVGIGWKFVETARQIVDGATGEKMVFVDIDLFVNIGGKWSAPIPGRGGDMLVETEKGKLVSNDEAVKMATTDALGNAMKYLGVAATVYSKGIDGTKYGRKSAEPQPANPTPPPTQNKGQNDHKAAEKPSSQPATVEQLKKISELATGVGWSKQDIQDSILATYGAAKGSDMTLQQAKEMIDYLEQQGEQKTASTGS